MPAQRLRHSAIEPLEDRIAPALLVNGANLLGGESPNSGETSVGGHAVTLVKVLAGRAIVWFDGFDITSVSFGPGAKLDIVGDVLGDVIGNLTADGQLSDSDANPANGEDGGVLLPNDLLGLTTHPLSGQRGSVGNVISGGGIAGVNVSGILRGVYAGDGVFRTESFLVNAGTVESFVDIDINPIAPGVQDTFSFAKANAQMKGGASIASVKVSEARELQVFAGNGSPDGSVAVGNGTPGGGISGINIETATVLANSPVDTPSYHLITGDGQAGKKGGAGGTINSVIEKTSTGPVVMTAGNGGAGTGGAGGGGGNVQNLDVQSASARYSVTAGDGGQGTPGGAGGRVAYANFSNRTPTTGVLVTADFTGDGIDDVLVADPGTGQMVLNKNTAHGADFSPVVQYVNGGDDVITIDAAGTTPVDGLATDMDADGDLDPVILYKDGTVGIFLNRGDGVFYSAAANNGAGGFEIRTFGVGYTPAKFSETSPGSQVFVIADNAEGRGTLHLVSASAFGGELSTYYYTAVRKVGLPIIDLVDQYAGLSDGTIVHFDFSAAEENAFANVQTLPLVLSGGLTDLDIDEGRTRLLALSGGGRMLAVYDISGATVPTPVTVSLSTLAGKPLLAKFVHDDDPFTEDDFVVLNALDEGALFTRFSPAADDGNPLTPTTYAMNGQFESTTLLKNFSPLYNGLGYVPSFAALAGPLSSFSVVMDFSSEAKFPLPFASKQVTVAAGNGGLGLDLGAKLGKGGAGGAILGINADAQKIKLTAGMGGGSTTGAAGAGGAISNLLGPISKTVDGQTTATHNGFKTAGGAVVQPKLIAELLIDLIAGPGGSPTGAGAKAAGGAGGDVLSLDITLANGDINFTAGPGGIGNGGAGGAGGNVKNMHTLTQSGSLFIAAGPGGAATGAAGNGGAGGRIFNLTHELTLDTEHEKVEQPYSVTLIAGSAGSSAGATGGAGGALEDIVLKLDGADRTYDNAAANPPLNDAHLDTTVTVTGVAGAGGAGAKGGGAGGGIRGFVSESVLDQGIAGSAFLNYVVLGLFAGPGGASSAGIGGAGGAIAFTKPISGVTNFDPDSDIYDPLSMDFDPTRPAFIALGGDGGGGASKGGPGGIVSGLTLQNAPFVDGQNLTTTELTSAAIAGGDGGTGGTGDGGAGGAVQGALVAVSGGYLDVFGGDGGASTSAKGGAGGMVSGSEFGLVNSYYSLGMNVEGGGGGAGKTAGGIGGALMNLRINTPQSTANISAFLTAGAGGAANLAAGVGGKGGDVNGITQAKDYNSSINLVAAGNGGANPLGKGGAGGNVMNVKTVGFIGRPSDSAGNQLGVFDSYLLDDDGDPLTAPVLTEFAQGLFSGRGGDGATDGTNGSISKITARQIAAMAAAADSMTGLFAVASSINTVTTALIGFDIDGDGIFDTTAADGATPSGTKPEDGFILAAAIAKVTGSRPAFTFTA